MENKSLISLLEEMNVLCRDNGKRFDEDSPRIDVIKKNYPTQTISWKKAGYRCCIIKRLQKSIRTISFLYLRISIANSQKSQNAFQSSVQMAFYMVLIVKCFSLCLPISGEMHSDEGVDARADSFEKYTEMLQILANIHDD